MERNRLDMNRFDQNFIEKVNKIKITVKKKYNLNTSNNILLLIQQLIELDNREGIYLELGTFRGSTILSCAEASISFNLNTKLYGLDTFQGFPKNVSLNNYDNPNHFLELFNTGMISKKHLEFAANRTDNFKSLDHLNSDYFQNIDMIFQHVKQYRNINLIKSEIKHGGKFITEPIKILFFDCDLYESYMDGLNIFYDKVIMGGSIIFDEYYSYKYPGAIQAVTDFFKNKNQELIKYTTPEGFERVMIKKT